MELREIDQDDVERWSEELLWEVMRGERWALGWVYRWYAPGLN